MRKIGIISALMACAALAHAQRPACTSANLNASYSDNVNNVQYLCTTAGWKANIGIGAPTVGCSPVNYGVFYTDVQGNNVYACTENGWEVAGGVGSVSITSSTGDLTVSPSPLTGTGTVDLNLGRANTWTAAQTFSGGATGVTQLGGFTYGPFLAVADGSFAVCYANSYFGTPSFTSPSSVTLPSNGSQNAGTVWCLAGQYGGWDEYGFANSGTPASPQTVSLSGAPQYLSDAYGDLTLTKVTAATFVGNVATGSGTSPAIAAGTRDFTITLTGATTATVTGIVAGADLNVEVCQSSGNSYVFTFPSAMHGVTSTTPAAGDCNTFLYHSFSGTTLELMASQTGLLP